MTEHSDSQHRFILPEGCQVVVLREFTGQGTRVVHPRGAVAIVIKSPEDRSHSYRVRFPDGMEEPVRTDDLIALAHYKNAILKGDASGAEGTDGDFQGCSKAILSSLESFCVA